MRRALWILSTPVVAGGLAWAVNAADDQGALLARAPAPQPGKIYYFSRGGNTAASQGSTPDDLDKTPDTSESEADENAGAQRYTRQRKPSAPSPRAKNYYQELFGENGSREQAATKRPVPASVGKTTAKKPISRDVREDYEIGEASPKPEDLSVREENPLPPADGQDYKLVNAAADADGVRHADHKEQDGLTSRRVVPVRNQIKMPPAKPKAARSTYALDETPTDPAAETFDAPVPPPPAATRAVPSEFRRALRTTTTTPARQVPRSKTSRVAAAPPAPADRSESSVVPAAAVVDESDASPRVQQVSAASFQTSDVPMISLQWVSRGELNVGQECKCGLAVKNTGKVAAKDIVVEAHFPRTVQLRDAQPFPNDTKGHLSWVFDHLSAGEEKTIEITMVPGEPGEFSPSATVRFTGVASTVLKVEEPQLAVALSGPREISVGETTTQIITVSNSGTGVAHDVVVHATIPEGLDYPRGKHVELWIGSLGPKDTREVRLPLSAVAGGSSLLQVEAKGSNLVQRAQVEIQIAAPRLKIEIAGPGLRYVGRHAQYVLTVANEGVAPTDNVRIVHVIPEGFEFVKADRGGRYDAGNTSVSWFLGRVEAGQSLQVAVDLNARQIGQHQHHVQAAGEGGSIATATLESKVDGSAAVVMEVADRDDPVEVNTETAYEIRIRNEGTKSAQNLKLACELPEGVELIETSGPSEHLIEKGILYFVPLNELPPGAKISYLIKVNGKTAGNLRLRAKLISNATTEPLIVEELTKFYGD